MSTPVERNDLPLTYGRFLVGLVPEAPLSLPAYAGGMFRGAFGIALQRTVCVTRTYHCAPCPLNARCLYPYVFETAPPPGTHIMRKYQAAPHPFVFEPPVGGGVVQPARPFALGLTLFGKGLHYLPHFVFALERLGQHGLGRERIRCALSSVESRIGDQSWPLYTAGDRTLRSADPFETVVSLSLGSPLRLRTDLSREHEQITIEFLTPLRIVYEERLATQLPFHVLVRSLLRRVAHLSYFHCGGDPSTVAFTEWIALAATVQTVAHDLTWFDWERYSTRQQSAMRLGGLVGRVTFEGNLAPFRPLLEVGEVIHAGKGTSFGLGRYRILSRQSPHTS